MVTFRVRVNCLGYWSGIGIWSRLRFGARVKVTVFIMARNWVRIGRNMAKVNYLDYLFTLLYFYSYMD